MTMPLLMRSLQAAMWSSGGAGHSDSGVSALRSASESLFPMLVSDVHVTLECRNMLAVFSYRKVRVWCERGAHDEAEGPEAEKKGKATGP